MRLRLAVVVLALVCAGPALHATSITYDFTYTGIGFHDTTAKATGSGSITFNVIGDTGMIGPFNFTDTITSSAGSSTFTYNSATLTGTNNDAIFTGSGANLVLTNVDFSTSLATGTNANFGQASFTASYSGVSNASTAGTQTSTDWLSDFTTSTSAGGSFTFTVAPPAPHLAATPEPSSLLLLGTGILGAFGAARRRFIA